MAYDPQMIQQLMGQPGAPMSGTPAPGAMVSPSGANALQGMSSSPGIQMLMQALLKQRKNNLLSGNLTPQTIGAGTAGADMATGPQTAPPNGPKVA